MILPYSKELENNTKIQKKLKQQEMNETKGFIIIVPARKGEGVRCFFLSLPLYMPILCLRQSFLYCLTTYSKGTG